MCCLFGIVATHDQSWNQNQVDQGSNSEDATSEKPNETSSHISCVKAMKAQNSESADEPEEVSNKYRFHFWKGGKMTFLAM